MNDKEFLTQWCRDYHLLQQGKVTRKELAGKYHRSIATIGNWIKCYRENKVPYKSLQVQRSCHGIKIAGIRKFRQELDYHFSQGSGQPLYIYYDDNTAKIWSRAEKSAVCEKYFLAVIHRNMYLREIYDLIFLLRKNTSRLYEPL